MKYTALILILALSLTSCEKENRWDCFKSLGDETTEVRNLGEFEAVFIEDKLDITWRYAPEARAEVTFGKNIVPYIVTDVRNGSLYIDNTAKCNWVRDLSEMPRIALYSPHFRYMENRGSGRLTFADTLIAPLFTYEEWKANGVNRLLIKTGYANIYKHTGPSDLAVTGYSDTAIVYTASIGKLNVSGLISAHVQSNNSSFQDMKLYSGGYLFAIIRGSGNILYAGEPSQIEEVNQGTGRLLPL